MQEVSEVSSGCLGSLEKHEAVGPGRGEAASENLRTHLSTSHSTSKQVKKRDCFLEGTMLLLYTHTHTHKTNDFGIEEGIFFDNT